MALIGVKEGIRNRVSQWDAPSRGDRITCLVTALANYCDGRMVGWSKTAVVAFYSLCSLCCGIFMVFFFCLSFFLSS